MAKTTRKKISGKLFEQMKVLATRLPVITHEFDNDKNEWTKKAKQPNHLQAIKKAYRTAGKSGVQKYVAAIKKEFTAFKEAFKQKDETHDKRA